MSYSLFRKTYHFVQRQWERCLDDFELYKLLQGVSIKNPKKTHLFVGTNRLKSIGINTQQTLVIIIIEQQVLVTLFFIDDFLNYIKSTTIQHCKFI